MIYKEYVTNRFCHNLIFCSLFQNVTKYYLGVPELSTGKGMYHRWWRLGTHIICEVKVQVRKYLENLGKTRMTIF